MTDDIDIGQISEALNDKMDRDVGNPATLGKERIANFAMPSDRYIDLTLGASGTQYVAPANGYIILAGELSANTWLNIRDDDILTNIYQAPSISSAYSIGYMFAIKKGGKFSINWGNGNWTGQHWQKFRFIYAKGEENV